MNPNFLEERVLIAGAGAVSAGGVGGLKSFLMLLHLNAKNPISYRRCWIFGCSNGPRTCRKS